MKGVRVLTSQSSLQVGVITKMQGFSLCHPFQKYRVMRETYLAFLSLFFTFHFFNSKLRKSALLLVPVLVLVLVPVPFVFPDP